MNEPTNSPMDTEELTTLVTQIVTEVTGKTVAHNKSDLAELGIDSMVKLDILATLEKHLNVTLNESAILDFKSVVRIVEVVEDAIRTGQDA